MNQIQTTESKQSNKQISVGEFLKSQKRQIEAALPSHLTSDRMLRIVMTEIRKNPKLQECTRDSLIGSVIQASQLGLEPGSDLGHAYLIPYKNQKTGNTECQLLIGYRGMIDLSRRSGQIVSLYSNVVFENDILEFEYGTNDKLRHVPAEDGRGKFKCVYSIAHLVGGGYQFEVMYKSDVDKIRDRSRVKSSGPWVTDYEEMAKKTCVRKLFKYLPVSIEAQKAVTIDEKADRGEQNNSMVLDGEFSEVEENEPQSESEKLAEKISQ